MQKRNIKITFRINDFEFNKLKTRVKKSGVSQEAYIRNLINGYIPADIPPPDYHSMMNELREIGTTMSRIADKAHAFNLIDADRYDEAFDLLKQQLMEITKAVSRPRKIERVE